MHGYVAAVNNTLVLILQKSGKHPPATPTRKALASPIVRAARVQLQQVILNLIVNSMEAMQRASEGPRELLISTGTVPSNGVVVAVRDSGPGVDPRDLERVFSAFYTAPNRAGSAWTSQFPARSSRRMEAHCGRLWIHGVTRSSS